MNTIDFLSKKQLTDLQGWALHSLLYQNNRIHPDYLERDGRKQKKLLRQLVEAELVEEGEDNQHTMNVTAILDTIDPVAVNLCQRWDEKNDNGNGWSEDFLLTTDHFSNAELCWLLTVNEDTQFYVVSNGPLRWSSYRYREEAGDPVEGDNGHPWWGPFNDIAAAIEQRKASFETVKDRHAGYDIVLTSAALRKHVDTTLFNHKIDKLYSQNLLWGLETLKIATINDLYYPLKDGEERRRPRISVSLDDGIFLGVRGSSLGDKSEDWENNLAKSLDRHRNQIEESQRAIELLTKIDTNIQKYGGWAKFKADYREALIEAVRKQEDG